MVFHLIHWTHKIRYKLIIKIAGEVVDALEHFFWGMKNGLAMEIGALDGSPHTRSMTTEYESQMGWSRILVEGDPSYREKVSLSTLYNYRLTVIFYLTILHSCIHYIHYIHYIHNIHNIHLHTKAPEGVSKGFHC